MADLSRVTESGYLLTLKLGGRGRAGEGKGEGKERQKRDRERLARTGWETKRRTKREIWRNATRIGDEDGEIGGKTKKIKSWKNGERQGEVARN